MKRFTFALTIEERRRVQKHLLKENCIIWKWCGFVIGALQIAMLILNLSSGAVSEKSLAYRFFYVALLVFTIIVGLVLYLLQKNKEGIPWFYRVSWLYMLGILLWSVGITYTGFEKNGDLSTFAYTAIATCAIVLMEPWAALINILISSGLLLTLLITTPKCGTTIGDIIQIVSILLLALIVSLVAFNRRLVRIRLEYDQMELVEKVSCLNQKLSKDISLDPLTGIYNRRYLTEHINDNLVYGEKPSGVLMVDIDFFKQINDTYGHQAGDDCLIMIGEQIQKIIGAGSDYAVRYGGEEFLLFFKSITRADLIAKADALRFAVKNNAIYDNGEEFKVTLSVGMAMAEEGMTYTKLISAADDNLYHAKENGRDMIWPREEKE
ncbi:MAG: GGDEF domain-containing protein [Parasporobacterium sp.]|nr:GGDEF domain-containing protein [Parasporobacterium sp.]